MFRIAFHHLFRTTPLVMTLRSNDGIMCINPSWSRMQAIAAGKTPRPVCMITLDLHSYMNEEIPTLANNRKQGHGMRTTL